MASKLQKETPKKNWNSQFKKAEPKKSLYDKVCTKLGLESEEQQRNSKELETWCRRYHETKFIPLFMISFLKINSEDNLFSGYDPTAPKFRAQTFREYQSEQEPAET